MMLILAAAQLLTPDEPPTFEGVTPRQAADIALCYGEQFGRQRDLRVATTRYDSGFLIALTSRLLFKEVREGTIAIDDKGDMRLVRFWFRRIKRDASIPPHLRKCIEA